MQQQTALLLRFSQGASNLESFGKFINAVTGLWVTQQFYIYKAMDLQTTTCEQVRRIVPNLECLLH
jgi:hypothetical protein